MNYGKSSNIQGTAGRLRLPKFTSAEITGGFLSAIAAFLLGACRLPFSVFPLGIAFVSAATKTTLPAALGLLASSAVVPLNKAAYITSVLAVVALRITFRLFIDRENDCNSLKDRLRSDPFGEALSLRAASAAISAFMLSLYPIISGGFRYYDLFGAILSISAASLATPLFYGASAVSDAKKTRHFSLYSKGARLSVSALLCLSLSGFEIKGFQPALTLAFILTVNFCISDGLAESCLCAILCGAACGLWHIPTLVIVALTAFCVLDVSPSLAAAVSCISGSICGVLILGSEYMTSPFLSLLLGCTLFSVFKKLTANCVSAQEAEFYRDLTPPWQTDKDRSLLDKITASLQLLSPDIADMKYAVDAVSALKCESDAECERDERLAGAISRRLYELGFGKVGAVVTGKRSFRIYLCGERLAGKSERADFVRRQAEAITGFSLTRSSLYKDSHTLVFTRDNAISYHHAIAQSPKEDVCGDAARVFCDKDRNYLYALICDGMGCGAEASAISNRALSVLESLLLSGISPQSAVASLSSLLKGRCGASDELSTTVDLLRLDLYTGDGLIIKSGAAPSYVKRGNELIGLTSHTVPVGILDITDTSEMRFTAKENDVIIMASDGVSECESDSVPISGYLSSHKASLPAEMANDIIGICRQMGKKDDLSVIAIKIFPQNY